MSKVLICLVSQQPLPNIMSAAAIKPDTVYLLASEDVKQQAEDLKKTFEVHFKSSINSITIKMMDVFNPNLIVKAFTEVAAELQTDDEVVFNWTGGTKPSALFGYIRLSSAIKNCKMLYVDSQNETFWWTVNREVEKQDINVNLSTDVLLHSKGKWDYTKGKLNDYEPLFPFIEQVIATGNLEKFRTLFFKLYDKRSVFNQFTIGQYQVINRHQFLEIKNQVNSFTYRLNSSDYPFFNGIWLEIYTAFILKNTKEYDHVDFSVKLNQELSGQQSKQLYNEIDVLAIRNGVPVFVECKTRAVDQADIYKLTNLRKEFGSTFAQAVIVATGTVSEVNMKKAQENNVIILNSIKDLKKQLGELHEYIVTPN
jgi:Holliday junction resolvase